MPCIHPSRPLNHAGVPLRLLVVGDATEHGLTRRRVTIKDPFIPALAILRNRLPAEAPNLSSITTPSVPVRELASGSMRSASPFHAEASRTRHHRRMGEKNVRRKVEERFVDDLQAAKLCHAVKSAILVRTHHIRGHRLAEAPGTTREHEFLLGADEQVQI